MTIRTDDVHVEDIPTDPRARREWNRQYREQAAMHERLDDLEAQAARLEATLAEILATLKPEGPVGS